MFFEKCAVHFSVVFDWVEEEVVSLLPVSSPLQQTGRASAPSTAQVT